MRDWQSALAIAGAPCYPSRLAFADGRTMADIFREVDEDVRNENAAKAFAKYQPYLIGLGVAIIAATVGYRVYDEQKRQAAETAGAHFESAVQLSRAGKGADAVDAFESLAKTGPEGYRILALLRAAADIGARDAASGANAFDGLAGKPEFGPQFQSVARLRAAMLLLDTAEPGEIAKRLEPLAATGQPLRHSAREMLAVSALAHNNPETAGKWLDLIFVDPQTPADVRKRAEDMAGLLAGSTTSVPKP